MQLSNEDNLRLNVMLAQNVQAVRIDESKMQVFSLTDQGEAKVSLNPTCKDEKYLKLVRELLSFKALGSPSGYPSYLSRWTRMGQTRGESLERLLLLGDTEAVVAAVYAEDLTAEVARRAWWAMPSAENARCMLKHHAIIHAEIGKTLAAYLIEFLPFEEEHKNMIETIRLVLQADLISEAMRVKLWKKAKHRNSYYVGFLKTLPDNLPDKSESHPVLIKIKKNLQQCDNVYAKMLLKLLSAKGQGFLKTLSMTLKKPNNQDVVIAIIEALENYFTDLSCAAEDIQEKMKRRNQREELNIDDIFHTVETLMQEQEIVEVLNVCPISKDYLFAMLVLSILHESIVTPVFSRSSAIGTVMRKKLMPIFTPVQEQITILSS